MDEALLEGMGLHPELIGLAKLSDFKIAIGNKATLIPNPGSSCYGVVMELPDEEVSALYSNPEVSEYKPELVNTVLLHNGSIYGGQVTLISIYFVLTSKSRKVNLLKLGSLGNLMKETIQKFSQSRND